MADAVASFSVKSSQQVNNNQTVVEFSIYLYFKEILHVASFTLLYFLYCTSTTTYDLSRDELQYMHSKNTRI